MPSTVVRRGPRASVSPARTSTSTSPTRTVVVPLLDPRHDRAGARAAARSIFPERRVIGVQAREILLGGGNIHCITQQVPAWSRLVRLGALRPRTRIPQQLATPQMNARTRDYERLMPALTTNCSLAQLDTRKLAKFSVAVIVTGVPSAGRSETVNKLLEWLDPKYVSVRAFGEGDRGLAVIRRCGATGARCRPSDAIAFYFWGWYGEYLGCALARFAQGASAARERELERIRQLETMLSADGVRVVKIHLDLDADTQRKRLKKLRGNKLTRWRVTHEDLWLARHHKAFRKAIERCIAASDQPTARWHLIDGADENYREVRVGELLRDELHGRTASKRRRPCARVRARRRNRRRCVASASARSTTTNTIASSNSCRDSSRC